MEKLLNVTLYINTGDLATMYTANNIYPHSRGEKGQPIANSASLWWLTKQQLYKKRHLFIAMNYQDFLDSKFLKSVYDELDGCEFRSSQLVLLTQMSESDYIKLQERLHDEKIPKNAIIALDENTTCGLINEDLQAGKLGIKLDKEIRVAIKKLEKAVAFKTNENSDIKVEGNKSSLWKPTFKYFYGPY